MKSGFGNMALEDINMQEFCIKMSKNDYTFVTYFVELCTNVISNVSNNVQREKSSSLLRVRVRFIWLPFPNSGIGKICRQR